MPINKFYKVKMTIYLEKEFIKKIKVEAANRGQFQSDFIKELVEEYLKKDKVK